MAETHIVRVHTEPVVLDIGQDKGGLIIYTRAERCASEIEVSPAHDDSVRVHTDVAARSIGGQTIYAAVYLPFIAGDYNIWGPDPQHPSRVTIHAGTVTEVDWS